MYRYVFQFEGYGRVEVCTLKHLLAEEDALNRVHYMVTRGLAYDQGMWVIYVERDVPKFTYTLADSSWLELPVPPTYDPIPFPGGRVIPGGPLDPRLVYRCMVIIAEAGPVEENLRKALLGSEFTIEKDKK